MFPHLPQKAAVSGEPQLRQNFTGRAPAACVFPLVGALDWVGCPPWYIVVLVPDVGVPFEA